MVATGLLIAFEGIDGSGKSTQALHLAQALATEFPHREVLAVREPGGTPVGEAVRAVLLEGAERGALAEALLYFAARAELYERVVLPALTRGAVVLTDRGNHSTAAYQGAGLGLDEEELLAWGERVVQGRWPDRVVWLRLDPAAALARLPGRAGAAGQDRIEARGLAYFERVAGAYQRFAAAEPGRFVEVDAAADAGAVARAVRAGLDDVL
jgi:dTMP kinase